MLPKVQHGTLSQPGLLPSTIGRLLAFPIALLATACGGPGARVPGPLPQGPDGGEAVAIAALEGATLAPGDPAPSLAGLTWLGRTAGPPDSERAVLVVTFWAPWCQPCHASMPRVAALETREAPPVHVVAVATPDAVADAAMIRRSTREHAAEMPSYVALDAEGRVKSAWRDAVGRSVVPMTFVVDPERRLAWIGHPTGASDVVDAVRAGTWDIAAARREYERLQSGRLAGFRLLDAWDAAIDSGDEEAIDLALDGLIEIDPEALPLTPPESVVQQKAARLVATGKATEAATLLRRAADHPARRNDGHALAALALPLYPLDAAAAADIADRAEAALRVEAQRAVDGDGWDHFVAAHPSATRGPRDLAQLRFEQGRLADAILWQERVVALLTPWGLDDALQQERERLERFRSSSR